jgi:hypothetical protein
MSRSVTYDVQDFESLTCLALKVVRLMEGSDLAITRISGSMILGGLPRRTHVAALDAFVCSCERSVSMSVCREQWSAAWPLMFLCVAH